MGVLLTPLPSRAREGLRCQRLGSPNKVGLEERAGIASRLWGYFAGDGNYRSTTRASDGGQARKKRMIGGGKGELPSGLKRGPIDRGRHESHCTIGGHPRRLESEQEGVAGGNTRRMARPYHVSRDVLLSSCGWLDRYHPGPRLKRALEQILGG
jgi:hypothetical protein